MPGRVQISKKDGKTLNSITWTNKLVYKRKKSKWNSTAKTKEVMIHQQLDCPFIFNIVNGFLTLEQAKFAGRGSENLITWPPVSFSLLRSLFSNLAVVCYFSIGLILFIQHISGTHQHTLYPIPLPGLDPSMQFNLDLNLWYSWHRYELTHWSCWGFNEERRPWGDFQPIKFPHWLQCNCTSTTGSPWRNLVRIGLLVFFLF